MNEICSEVTVHSLIEEAVCKFMTLIAAMCFVKVGPERGILSGNNIGVGPRMMKAGK